MGVLDELAARRYAVAPPGPDSARRAFAQLVADAAAATAAAGDAATGADRDQTGSQPASLAGDLRGDIVQKLAAVATNIGGALRTLVADLGADNASVSIVASWPPALEVSVTWTAAPARPPATGTPER